MILHRLLNSHLFSRVSPLVLLSLSSLGALASSEHEGKTGEYKYPNQYLGSVIANMMVDYDTPFVLYPYDTNYLLTTYTSHINKEPIKSYDWANHAQKVEAKFQISLGFPIWRGIVGDNSLLGASYTQRSWWQAFNHKQSSPFRETNYEPQLFLAWLTDWRVGGWTIREVETGMNHQSNGRSEKTSRSWNRAYMRVSAVNGNWLVDVKPWIRINEPGRRDDNRDITKYMGYYRAKIGYQWGDSVFSVNGHYNWSSGYGGAEAGWSYPLTKHVRFYTQVFSGYGESMIDYNQKQSVRVGAGFMLNDLF
jgi:phospholipase A1